MTNETKTPTVRERMAEACGDDELLLLDPEFLDDAIVGVGSRYGEDDVVVYDRAKVVALYALHMGMSHEEAEEFVSFNTDRAHVGPRTPILLERIGSILERA